jgi:hypothetical protein
VAADTVAQAHLRTPEAVPAAVAETTPHPERSHTRSSAAEVPEAVSHTPADTHPQAAAPVVQREGVVLAAAVPAPAREEAVLVVLLVEPCSTRSRRPCCSLVPSPVARHPVSVSRRSFRIPQEMQKSTPHVPTAPCAQRITNKQQNPMAASSPSPEC